MAKNNSVQKGVLFWTLRITSKLYPAHMEKSTILTKISVFLENMPILQADF